MAADWSFCSSSRRVALVAALLLVLAAPAAGQDALIVLDPEKVVGSEACGECHADEYEVWKNTRHATGFKTLHRSETSELITEKMGFKLIKRESLCLDCHYTPTIQRGQVRAGSGVSCESCHGAGRDWIDLHNDYGPGATRETETPEHRAERIAKSEAAGMRRPTDLYPVVKSCYSCHMVLHEALVNVGGHSTGTGDFEFVMRSQGDIRHNFVAAQYGGSRENLERSAERKRAMYVVGRAVALESALRGAAAATENGVYLKAMSRRVRVTAGEVRAIARRAELPEVDEMLAAAQGVRVALGKREALLAAADAIGQATQRFLNAHDGTQLASLDPLVLGTADDFEDEVEIADAQDDASATDDIPTDAGGTAAAEPGTGTPAADSGTATAAPTTAKTTTIAAIPAVGEKKSRIRPRSSHDTLGPGSCSRCHGPQNGWWFEDKHYAAADPFFDQRPENIRIARLYGIKPSQMTRGDQVCMDCHGTVVSGKERREVQDGVSCESCHGAAADWLEPHQEGDKSLGLQRPGYQAGLRNGKKELKNPAVRAKMCTECHYITEPRLISAGHPSGQGFDYAKGTQEINHWETPIPAATLASAFQKELASRGAVPDVQRARLASTVRTGGNPAAANRAPTPTELSQRLAPRPSAGGSAFTGRPSTSGTSDRGTSGGTTSPGDGGAPADLSTPAVGDLALPPFPDLGDGVAIEDILLAIKKRLELLYEKVYPSSGENP